MMDLVGFFVIWGGGGERSDGRGLWGLDTYFTAEASRIVDDVCENIRMVHDGVRVGVDGQHSYFPAFIIYPIPTSPLPIRSVPSYQFKHIYIFSTFVVFRNPDGSGLGFEQKKKGGDWCRVRCVSSNQCSPRAGRFVLECIRVLDCGPDERSKTYRSFSWVGEGWKKLTSSFTLFGGGCPVAMKLVGKKPKAGRWSTSFPLFHHEWVFPP